VRKALRYRLFGMGKMPDALKAAAAGADVVLADEGLPVHNHVNSLRIPGARIGRGVRTISGAIVILPGRLLASIGKYVILDTDFRADGGQQELALSGDGVRIKLDVASMLHGGSGSVEVHYRIPLVASVLSQLPVTNCRVALSHPVEALVNPWLGTYAGGRTRTGAS
jgi:hypothetical protein